MTFSVMNLQIAFNKWAKTNDKIAHGENEYERAQLIDQASKLAEPWRSEYPQDWEFMRELREQWRINPDDTRDNTAAALREDEKRYGPRSRRDADNDNFEYRKISHLSYVQHFFDPQVQEEWDWREMHDKRARLNAELAASRSDTETEQIQARLAELDDETDWPATWRRLEQEHAHDFEFWHEQSETSGEYYMQIIRARETAGQAAVEEEVEELEETQS